MKFLADMNVSMSTVRGLRAENHDVVHLREQGLECLSDSEIMAKAKRENRVILTFDLDFGDILAATRDALPSVVIFRLSNQAPQMVRPILLDLIRMKRQELEQGAIVIAEDKRYRIRRLPVL